MISLQLLDELFEAELSQERERCAKIVEALKPEGLVHKWTDQQIACFEALTEAAKNIRNDNIVIDSEGKPKLLTDSTSGRVQINEST